MGGARGAAGRGLAAVAGARPAGAPWCGRERSMGRRLLRALLCLLLLACRGLLRDGSASATAAHGETGVSGRAVPRAVRGSGSRGAAGQGLRGRCCYCSRGCCQGAQRQAWSPVESGRGQPGAGTAGASRAPGGASLLGLPD